MVHGGVRAEHLMNGMIGNPSETLRVDVGGSGNTALPVARIVNQLLSPILRIALAAND